MKVKLLKRSVAAFLAVVMMLSLLPVSVFAADDGMEFGELVENEFSPAQGTAPDGESLVETEGQESDPANGMVAQPPHFTKNLGPSVSYVQGDAAVLSVEAVSDDGGTITYQWYWNSSADAGTGTPVNGARGSTYEPSTINPGTMYFYAVATNTLENGSSASAASNVIMVTVAAPAQEEEPPADSDMTEPDATPAPEQNRPAKAPQQQGEDVMPAVEGDEAESQPDKEIDGVTYQYYNGQTEEGKYYITEGEQMWLLSKKVAAKNTYAGSTFILLNDVDIAKTDEQGSPVCWVPIGTKSSLSFSGNFDGNNHEITGLNIVGYTVNWVGLFGSVKSVNIRDLTVRGTINLDTTRSYVGGIVGLFQEVSQISNCASYVNINATGSKQVGGIIGQAKVTPSTDEACVSECINYGSIGGNTQVGGIVGYLQCGITIESCENHGSITAETSAGGIVGAINASSSTARLEDCHNTGDITGSKSTTSAGVGGIVGTHQSSRLIISSCTNSASVTGVSSVGGILGIVKNPTTLSLEVCENKAKTETTEAALTDGAAVISGSGYGIGGIVGQIGATSDAKIISCNNTAEVQAVQEASGLCGSVGGIIGEISSAAQLVTIRQCSNDGAVTAPTDVAGGIVGKVAAAAAEETGKRAFVDCTNKINGVVTAGRHTAGGIVGQGEGCELTNCTNNAPVTAQYCVGGIAAELAKSTMRKCNNSGAVTDTGTTFESVAGGLAAIATGDVTIEGSRNSGVISGAYHVGGLLGMSGAQPGNTQGVDVEWTTALVLKGSTNTGEVKVVSNGGSKVGYAGGLIGLLHAGTGSSAQVLRCSNQGAVSAVAMSVPYVGGLFGSLTSAGSDSSNGTLEIRYCCNTAPVTGGDQVGGFAGRIGPWKDTPGTLTFTNCYSAGTVASNSGLPLAKLQVGAAVGAADGTEDSGKTISNAFALGSDMPAIGSNNSGADGSAFTLLSDETMKSGAFLVLLGDAFTGAVDAGYPALAPEEPAPAKKNVQFYGAENTVVTIGDTVTYAVTVEAGGTVSFKVEGKEDTVQVKRVSVGGENLVPADGVYILSNVQSDTIVQVATNGETSGPEVTGEEVIFRFVDQNGQTVSDVTLTVASSGSEQTVTYQPDKDGHFHLVDGTYAITASSNSYYPLNGTFTVSETAAGSTTYQATLYPAGIGTSTLTLGLGGTDFYVELYNGDIAVAKSNTATGSSNSDTTFDPLPVGNYRYQAIGAPDSTKVWSGKPMGSGPLTLTQGSQTVKLRFVNFAGERQSSVGGLSSLKNANNVHYNLEITDPTGRSYTPGSTSPYSGSDKFGDPRGFAVLPSASDGAEYRYRFIPQTGSDNYFGSSGTIYLYNSTLEKDFYGFNLSDNGYFIIAPKSTQVITVPTGADLRVYRCVKLYESREEIDLGAPEKASGSDTYTVTVPTDVDGAGMMFYEVTIPGYVKYAGGFQPGQTAPIIVSISDLTADSKVEQVDSNHYEQNILVSAPDSKCINLAVGQRFDLYCSRNRQAIYDDGGNRYVQPTYHIERIFGDSVVIEDEYDGGAFIKGVKEGISFVRVTYDGLYFKNHLYPGIAEQNVVILAVIVGQNGTAVIDPGITQSEFDRAYYIRSINGVQQSPERCYAEYTFKPSVTGGELEKVEIHAPVGSTGNWDNNAWMPVERSKNDPDAYTAKLYDGRSMIRITAKDGTVAFYSLSAYGLDIKIEGDGVKEIVKQDAVKPDDDFSVKVSAGSQIKISFEGLELPVPKMGAIYNPGYPDKTYLTYTLSGTGSSVSLESTHTQYDIGTVNDITISAGALGSPGTYALESGRIHTSSIGEGGGAHRSLGRGGGTSRNFIGTDSSGNAAENINGLFCTLPDLKITVVGDAETGEKRSVTITVPNDANRVIVRNSQGYLMTETNHSNGDYTYELADNGGGESAKYSYAVERPGYITKTGTIDVTVENQRTVDLTGVQWQKVSQSGTVTVSVIGDFAVPATNKIITIAADPDDLYGKTYVDYNYGGYTVLHALLDTFTASSVTSTCSKGVLSLKDISDKDDGEWVCSVNNVKVEDYANTLVNGGDQIVFYYKTAAQTQRAWFEPATAEAAKDGSATFTVKSISVDNPAAGEAGIPVSGAILCIDGKEWTNAITGVDGSATLTGLDKLARGNHTVTVKKDGLTYARAILTITGPQGGTSSGDRITVTFRLIGDKARGNEAYDQYVNWIGTTTCELPKDSTVDTLFTSVLKDNGFTYEGVESNYVKSITVPQSLGGYELSEFSNGSSSGWMYTVNGTHPDRGLNDWTLYDGDEVIWHYVNSGVEGTDADSWYVNPWLFAADTSPSVPGGSEEPEPDASEYDKVLASTLNYLAAKVPSPICNSTNGEWAVLAQARGNALSETAKGNYLANLWLHADELKGVLAEFGFKYTEYSRVILALTSIGVDASNFKSNGRIFDFVTPLLDKDCKQVIEQGNNGTAFALIALDSGNYLNNAEGKKARATWIDSLATEQKADGSWPILSGEAGSIDITAMAVQALAPYYKDAGKLSALGAMSTDHAKLKSMVDSAVAWLVQQSGNNYDSCEGAAQMLVAMTALGNQEHAGKALESLLTYQVGNTGSFCTQAGGEANQMSTEQAAYALVAYDRFQNSKNSLYDMTDVTLSSADLNLAQRQYTITVKSGGNGTISPSTTTVTKGSNKTFTITPNTGYQIKDVLVDGVSIGAQSSYPFILVDKDHIIEAEFERATGSHTITVNYGVGGTISPSTATVAAGGSKTFTITPFTGYRIVDVNVDGVSIGARSSHTFTSVDRNHTISATFAAATDDITVYFTLKGDIAHGDSTSAVHTLSNGGLQTWISRQAVTVSRGATVYDVFTKVLNQQGYSSIGAEQNYVKTITTPSGVRLSEFTNGRNSGWMYTVNGTHPDQGLQSWTVYNGDEIIWHYTDDYTQERGGTGTSSTINGAAQLTPTVSGNNSTVTSNDFSNAVTAAINSNSGTVLITPQGSAWAGTLTVNLPTNTLYSAANNGVGVTVQSGTGTVAIPSYALSGIANVAGGSQVSITTTAKSAQQVASLLSGRTDVTAAQLANCAVTEVTMTSGGRNITSWGGRAITIGLPVNSGSFTAGNRYAVYQISANGSVEVLTGYCSRRNGSLYVEVSTSHLSTFVVLPKLTELPDSDIPLAGMPLPFTDVAVTDWFYDAVSYVYNRGLFNGNSATAFAPYAYMNRAMLVTVLHRYEGLPATTGATGFKDVPVGQWFSSGVSWASGRGVVNGKSGTAFAPYDNITREEIAVILYRYAKIKGWDVSAAANLNTFADGAKTSDWAARAMQWACAKGIINGKSPTMLDPNGCATRAEVAAMLMRFIEAY